MVSLVPDMDVEDFCTEAQDLEAEQALLGIVLSGGGDIPNLTRIVTGPEFYRPAHEQVWNACLAVHKAGLTPDPVTVRAELGGMAERHGGAPYLHTLMASAGIGPQAPWYATKVHGAAVRRQVGAVGIRLNQMQANPDYTAGELITKARAELDSLENHQRNESVTAGEAFERVMETVDHGGPVGTPTPWPELTDLLGGWFPGQLVIVAARPGVGKSILLENVATDMARTYGRRTLLVSLEMSAEEITQRTLAYTAKVHLSKIRAGASRLSTGDMDAIADASTMMFQTPLDITEGASMSVDGIRSAAWATRQKAARNGEVFGGVGVDYAQLIETPGTKGQSRQQALGEVSRGLKRLARELKVPVWVAAQVGRDAQERPPILSDIREAGDFENDADVVIFLHEEKVQDGDRTIPTGEMQLIVAKSRNGPQGVRGVYKHGHFARLHQDGRM